MSLALRMRGLPTASLRCRLRGLSALPVIWLLRLAVRAERVGAAMEVRGFDGSAGAGTSSRQSPIDRGAMAGAFALFAAAVAGRWMGGGWTR
jgi:energy-coupling factor transporter transmembrane protein EcfT